MDGDATERVSVSVDGDAAWIDASIKGIRWIVLPSDIVYGDVN